MAESLVDIFARKTAERIAAFRERKLTELCCELWKCHAEDVCNVALTHKLVLATQHTDDPSRVKTWVEIDGNIYGFFVERFNANLLRFDCEWVSCASIGAPFTYETGLAPFYEKDT